MLYQSYINVYAVYAGLKYQEMGWMRALRNLASSLLPVYSGREADVKGRKPMIIIGYTLVGMMILLLVLHPTVSTLILGTLLIAMGYSVAAPAWAGLIGDYTVRGKRGEVIGKVGAVGQASSIASTVIVAFLTYRSRETYGELLAVPLILSGLFSFASALVTLMVQERIHDSGVKRFSTVELRNLLENRYFRRFVLLGALNFFTMSIAWSGFPYVLSELTLNQAWRIAVLWSSWSLTGALTQKWIGKITDERGKRLVLLSGWVLTSTLPASYAAARNWVHLIAVHLAGGVIWSMVNIAQMSYILDSATGNRMASCSAVFNMVTGLTGFVGSLIGGYIMSMFPGCWIMDPTRFVLMLSAGLRVASGLTYLSLKEPTQIAV